MIQIYQIGRFEGNIIYPLNFKIENKIYSTVLSSFALKKYFEDQGETVRVNLIYPVSLLLNKSTYDKNKDAFSSEFIEKLDYLFNYEEGRTSFLKDPYSFYSLHPHSKEADDFLVIHSLGEFENIRFRCRFEDLILEIFIYILSNYIETPFNKLYIDISSGQNIYVSALLEAGRLFLTFYWLQNFLPEENPLEVYITFSEPIIPPFNQIFEIFKNSKLEVKAFFSYPQRPEQLDLHSAYSGFIKNKLLLKDKNIKRKLNLLFTQGYLFYSAIKNNTPLVLYTLEYNEPEEIDSGIRDLIELLKEKLIKHYQEASEVDFDAFRKAFLMLAIYKGIVKALKAYEITPKKEVPLSELQSKFRNDKKTLYKFFGLMPNRAYLGHEISNNFEKEGEKGIRDKLDTEYRLLREFISGENDDLKPRNFFAHCGFERNCTLVKKENGEIWLKYSEDKLDEIKKYLLEY